MKIVPRQRGMLLLFPDEPPKKKIVIKLRAPKVDLSALEESGRTLSKHLIRLTEDRERVLKAFGQTTWRGGSPASYIHSAIVALHNAEAAIFQQTRGES